MLVVPPDPWSSGSDGRPSERARARGRTSIRTRAVAAALAGAAFASASGLHHSNTKFLSIYNVVFVFSLFLSILLDVLVVVFRDGVGICHCSVTDYCFAECQLDLHKLPS